MVRKYLNKKDESITDDRNIELGKSEQTEATEYDELKEDLVNANKQIHSIANHLGYQAMKIERIKRIHDEFEKQLNVLNSDQPQIAVVDQTKKTEFENIGNEFDTKKIMGNITSILEKQGQSRISELEKLLLDEKTRTELINNKVQQDLLKFGIIEMTLKNDKNMLESIIKEKTERLLKTERMSAIADLASRMAHDMKNPLAAIKGSIQIIKKVNQDKLDDLSVKKIELIESCIFRMTHQIDGVLDFLKDTPLNITQSSIIEVIMGAIDDTPVPQNISLVLPDSDYILSCDSQKLRAVFSNIILNSIQAIGIQKGTIAINVSKNNDHLIIDVVDSGPGILPDDLPQIFDPLFTTKQIGTGLGLSICKKIILQHGGTIEVANAPTKFSIILPV